MDTRIVWLRRDLRLADHPALDVALGGGGADLRVVPVFVVDPAIVERGRMSAARLRYLSGALTDLDARLRARSGRLVVRYGDAIETLVALADEVSADSVHVCRDHSPYARRRDDAVAQALGEAGVVMERHGGLYVMEPGSVLTNAGDVYKVFTPFHRAWRDADHGEVIATPDEVPVHGSVASDDIPSPEVLLDMAGVADGDLDVDALPEPGETAARRRLDDFLAGDVDAYADRRDLLAADATSRLSADLHYGCVSAREIDARLDRRNLGQKAFGTEIAWRDFYEHVLARWPEVVHTAFDERMRELPWATDGEGLEAWTSARTGYPIVDAAMTQLHRTGWMHNRARMIVASFLCKDLRVHWRVGEDHFLAHLVDGDLASNNGGWQWAAGTGTDAQPFFRIFNPITQGERFDPKGEYVRRWLPVLAHVPSTYVHHPWDMPDDVAGDAGVRIGVDYPGPVVDHQQARKEALDWFDEHRS